MDTVFTQSLGQNSLPGIVSIYGNRNQLFSTLQRASSRAAQVQHPILASFTQSIKPYDPLLLFRALKLLATSDNIFWEQPSTERAMVGTGQAASLMVTGEHRFAEAAAQWQALVQEAIVGSTIDTPEASREPLLLGGFAFDPLGTQTELWQDFPDGLLLLSTMLVQRQKQDTTLTFNLMVHASDDLEKRTNELLRSAWHLFTIAERLTTSQPQESMSSHLTLHDLLPASTWKQMVAETVERIQQGAYQKVVLARAVEVTGEEPFAIDETLARLRASYPMAYVFAIQRGERYFVGATPERLLRAEDGQLQALALAGSAPRGQNPEEDQRLGNELLESEKNRDEHQIVVSTIRSTLAELCSHIWVAEQPQLLKLQNIQHLQTPLVGTLLPEHTLLTAIAALHPTPAVGGYPRLAALEDLRAHEMLDRGWYAGPIGWIDAQGNGEFAVALRSALIEKQKATLFVGCGIVADSDPQSEYNESCLKLRVMLRGLSGKE